MVRIRVIHASRLLAVLAAAALAVALAALAFRAVWGSGGGAAQAAFSIWRPPAMAFELPQAGEGGAVSFSAPDGWGGAEASARPRVLIYHTHTHEAYAQTPDDPYDETEPWRTDDAAHSVVRVGAELAAQLEARGVEAVHDATDHEYPRLSDAYAHSLDTLMGYDQTAFDLRVDLHRDAWDASLADCAYLGGRRAAQLMLLVGRGEGCELRPDYEANLAFAARLTARLNAVSEGLCRPVLVKDGRYNQHAGAPSILVEAGHNLNTLEEALRSMPALAEAICALLTGP